MIKKVSGKFLFFLNVRFESTTTVTNTVIRATTVLNYVYCYFPPPSNGR